MYTLPIGRVTLMSPISKEEKVDLKSCLWIPGKSTNKGTDLCTLLLLFSRLDAQKDGEGQAHTGWDCKRDQVLLYKACFYAAAEKPMMRYAKKKNWECVIQSKSVFWSQFHQPSTNSLYEGRYQKHKKDSQASSVVLRFQDL